ncbi:hypothetical protein ACFWPK_05895 [Nocardia sp. NPDC058519]|uniref:hypothetical protein n=1 Tax=Nocardia sp. NPDC058519 TaxID=3346535 RepID=UPI00364DFA5A
MALAQDYEKGQHKWLAHMRGSRRIAQLFDRVAPMYWNADYSREYKETLVFSLSPNGSVVMNKAMIMILGSECLKVWRRSKIVYRVHPGLAAGLADTPPARQPRPGRGRGPPPIFGGRIGRSGLVLQPRPDLDVGC